MKPVPYLGTFPYPLVSWKGKTLNQITSSMKYNGKVNTKYNLTGNSLFLPRPLKIYRREIANTTADGTCSSRASLSVDEFNRPGGSIINSISTVQNGLVNTLDDTFPKNTCEKPGTCLPFLSSSETAKRRVRSSGIIKRQFDLSKNNDTYCTSTKQYLISRNLSFNQNQYNYIRQGNGTSKPGDSLSSSNVYSPNGLSHCVKYTIKTAVTFQYQWLDATYNTVTINPGSYTVEDINSILHQTMAANKHYYVSIANGISIFLLSIGYDNNNNVVQLQVNPSDTSIYPSSKYNYPFSALWTTPVAPNTVVPGFSIQNNSFQDAVGFTHGNYPAIAIGGVQSPLTSQTFTSSFPPQLNPAFVKIYYKPSNPQYASQGGVTASEVILRTKYETITTAAGTLRGPYGSETTDALAYGVSEQGYTAKTKKGYPLPSYPKFTTTGELRMCSDNAIRG